MTLRSVPGSWGVIPRRRTVPGQGSLPRPSRGRRGLQLLWCGLRGAWRPLSARRSRGQRRRRHTRPLRWWWGAHHMLALQGSRGSSSPPTGRWRRRSNDPLVTFRSRRLAGFAGSLDQACPPSISSPLFFVIATQRRHYRRLPYRRLTARRRFRLSWGLPGTGWGGRCLRTASRSAPPLDEGPVIVTILSTRGGGGPTLGG